MITVKTHIHIAFQTQEVSDFLSNYLKVVHDCAQALLKTIFHSANVTFFLSNLMLESSTKNGEEVKNSSKHKGCKTINVFKALCV